MNRIYRTIQGTKSMLSVRWSPRTLTVPSWVVNMLLWVTVVRSFSYGVELLFIVTNNPISQMMAFAAIFGIQLWGVLMLGAVLTVVAGLILRRTFIVMCGSLLSAAVWVAFSVVLGIGYVELYAGGRFVVAALATGVTWAAFFYSQLVDIRKGGFGRE